MKPTRQNALVDLIDRMMDKGVVLYADLIISVSGIPLIGVNLRAAIAGMKTMLDYGMMEAWDEEIRKYALQNDREFQPSIGEETVPATVAQSCRDFPSGSGRIHATEKMIPHLIESGLKQ